VPGDKLWIGLAGLGWLALTGGCQSTGARGASATGPSPLFGLSAPAQSEPPLEDGSTANKEASRSQKSDAAVDPESDGAPATARNRGRRQPGTDNDPGQRKALPVSARTAAAADDDGLDL
jgi:hypothetical protein